MIFPYSFRKAYLGKPVAGALPVQTSGTTDIITAGVFGLCTAPNGIEGPFISSATAGTVKLVTGSWYPNDKIAPFYGGLQAPYYSRPIDPRKVTRFIKSLAITAQQQIITVGWDQTSGSTVGPVFYCGQAYNLRLDFLGSPALRLLNHQLYIDIPAWGGCCGTDCSSGCTAAAVDPVCIMLQWKDFFNYGTASGQQNANQNTNAGEVPYLNQFFKPQVFYKSGATKVEAFSANDVATGNNIDASGNTQAAYVCNTSTPASVIATFQLTGSYVDTKYGNCTFTPSDYFETEPIFAHASLVTQDFSPCAFNTTANTSVPNMVTTLQNPAYPKGLGEGVVRELVQSEQYKQNPLADSIYVDSLRFREIEGTTWMISNVNRQGYYDVIGIAYNTGVANNNSYGMQTNDQQYFEMIFVPAGTDTSAFTTLFQACLTAAGSQVVLETSSTAIVNGVIVPTGI